MTKNQVYSLLLWGLATACLGGCGSCGQGSHAIDDGTEDAGPAVVRLHADADGGRPIRIHRNVPLVRVDGAAPP